MANTANTFIFTAINFCDFTSIDESVATYFHEIHSNVCDCLETAKIANINRSQKIVGLQYPSFIKIFLKELQLIV